MKLNKIVVCGATGNQGGAVVRALLQQKNWHVVALTRNLQSASAIKLLSLGADVVIADTGNKETLLQAFAGAYGVFAVTQPWSANYKKCDIDNEILQGLNIISACGQANIKHLVLSSIINPTNQQTGVPHVDSKLVIEQCVKSSNLPYTIIRFPQFMDNIGTQFFPVKKGLIKGFVDADAKVPYIACENIGTSVARVFDEPNRASYKTFTVIGDFVSGHDLANIMSQVRNGEKFKYKAAPKFLLRLFAKEFYAMRVMFEKMGRAPYPKEITDALQATDLKIDSPVSMKDHLYSAGFATKPL